MSVWSLLLACQGLVYDGPAGTIGFRPGWKPEDHRSFFTAAEGWGLFTQRRVGHQQIDEIAVHYGKLRVAELVFQVPEGARVSQVSVTVDNKPLATRFTVDKGNVRITLERPVVIEGTLSVTIATAKLDERFPY